MSLSASQAPLFSLLPKARTPWTEFVFSTGTQALLVVSVVWVRLLMPVAAASPEHATRLAVVVTTPTPVNHQPQPRLRMPVVAQLEPLPNTLRLPAPQPRTAEKAVDAPVPTVPITAKKLEALPADKAPAFPKQIVRTNLFSTGSSATPTTSRPASQVQTGGFGDPNGIPAKAGQGKPVNIAALGSFDLPSGGGNGNGTGGTKGVPGVVQSSGFGNGTATGDNTPRTARKVETAGFGSGDVVAQPSIRNQPQAAPRIVPAEILAKPTPDYTQEARSLRIEGEVLLEVVLEASGNLHVVRVVRGLGHGLDDNAVRAAEQIRFKPALKDGQPSDSTVVLHIIFQLA